MEEIEKTLMSLGISQKEAKIYLILLRNGESSASEIGELSKLNRITCYTLLKNLQLKGIVNNTIQSGMQYFEAVSPNIIINIIENKKQRFKSILPLLKEKEKIIKTKTEVSIFEGKKGILNALEIIIDDAKKSKEVFAYGNFVIADSLIEYESLHWRKKRINNNIKIKAVINKAVPIEKYKSLKGYEKLTEIKENKKLEAIESYTLISENYVGIIFPSQELKGLLIKDKSAVEKEKFIFEMLWEQGK
jgi:sugar-specific transcriptional regulator TrmB